MDNHHQRPSGDQRMNSVRLEGQQILKVSRKDETLTEHLMEKVCEPSNLNRAYRRVKANKGAAGVDGMTVDELLGWIALHKESLIESLLKGGFNEKEGPYRIPSRRSPGLRRLGERRPGGRLRAEPAAGTGGQYPRL